MTGVVSSDSGQSGITDSGSGFSAGNGAGIVPQQRAWQFRVRDSRAGSSGRGHGGSTASPPPAAVVPDWRLPPMAPKEMISAVGPHWRRRTVVGQDFCF